MPAEKISGIYALCCPDTGEVRYVGQSKNIQKRYNAHINDTASRTRKSEWVSSLVKLNKKPELKILEKTSLLDERESFWTEKFRREGSDILNIVDGPVRFVARGSKDGMPWGRKRAPVQCSISHVARTVKDFEADGMHDVAEKLRTKLVEMRQASKDVRKMGRAKWVQYNLMLICRNRAIMKEYSGNIDFEIAERFLNNG